MAAAVQSESKGLYSWWWDSHISPKNSRWLQENLTDMDTKVKAMIKLIEEDADSFARRAEMYYEKRPELMKLVEEFYRAYRALAERYDSATVELRHAHRTMAEVFPDQVPFTVLDCQEEPLRPSASDSQAAKWNETSSDESGSQINKDDLKQLNLMFSPEAKLPNLKNSDSKTEPFVKLDHEGKAGSVLQASKESLAEANSEKEALFLQYQQSLANLRSELDEKAIKAETEAQNLRSKLLQLEAEKESSLLQYKQCPEKVSALEGKITNAEEQTRRVEIEIFILKQALSDSSKDKEAMESELSCAQEDVRRLNSKVSVGMNKLKSAEECCVDLRRVNDSVLLEADNMAEKMVMKDQELLQKNEELDKLRVILIQVEAMLKALQDAHSQSQEDHKALVSEVRNGLELLRDLEKCKQELEREIQRLNRENQSLNNLNLTSNVLINDMQHDTFNLRKTKGKLEMKVAEQVDQLKSLQKDFYYLKEEVNKYQALLEQLKSVGLEPESAAASVKALQDENSMLKDFFQTNNDEKVALLKKLESMGVLLQKNSVLENSLLDVTEKVKTLQESYSNVHGEKSLLVAEKSTLFSQLQILTENMQKLLEKDTKLEDSFTLVNAELEGLKEESEREKSVLLSEREMLASQLEIVERKLKSLEKGFVELEEQYVGMEKELESMGVLLEKNSVLENSLLDVTEKAKTLQESYSNVHGEKTLLVAEKSALFSQLQILTENMQKLLEKDTKLEDSFTLVNAKLEGLKEKSEREKSVLLSEREMLASQLEIVERKLKNLEKGFVELEEQHVGMEKEKEKSERESSILLSEREMLASQLEIVERKLKCLEKGFVELEEQYVGMEKAKEKSEREKSVHLCEREMLASQLEIVEQKLKSLEKGFVELEEQYVSTEKEKCCALHQVEDLQSFLGMEKQKCKSYILSTEARSAEMENHIHLLQEASRLKHREFEEEQDKAFNAQVEIFILQRCVHDLEENSFCLLMDCEQYTKASETSERLILELESENLEQQVELELMLHEIISLEAGISKIFKALQISPENEFDSGQRSSFSQIDQKIDEMKRSLLTVEDEKQQLLVENSVLYELIRELRQGSNSKLMLEIDEGNHREELLKVILSQKERELSDAEDLGTELCRTIEGLERECGESNLTRVVLENQVIEFSKHSLDLSKEIEWLHETSRNTEEKLSSELLHRSHESELCEAEAGNLYLDLQVCSVCKLLSENKVHELASACGYLEAECASRSAELEQMKEKVDSLEGELDRARAQLSVFNPMIYSLRDSITSLEHNSVIRKTNCVEDEQEDEEYRAAAVPDGASDLQKMQMRGSANSSVKQEDEELNNRTSLQTTEPERNTIVMKDIPLDEVLSCSFHGEGEKSDDNDDQMLVLWETDCDPSVHEAQARKEKASANTADEEVQHQVVEDDTNQKSQSEYSKSQPEKERAGAADSREDERDSETLSLQSLQTTVQDLRRKIDGENKNRRSKGAEYEKAEEQLRETGEALAELVEASDRLRMDPSPSTESQDAVNGSAVDQARRLLSEVQRIQAVVMKLDDERKDKGSYRLSDVRRSNRTSSFLKVLIYRGGRQGKGSLCGCFNPPSPDGDRGLNIR